MRIDEKINKSATNNLKSNKYLKFNAIIKNKIRNGKQKKLYSLIKSLSLIFDLKNCKALIEIETGINILIVFAKSYPNTRKEGVPNSNNPTPKTD
jgi:hypothetical protein|tara:strand:+ start:3432 stop:3716 length:285 start_codon:yes stop_codon:yes gene_type:complete